VATARAELEAAQSEQ